MKAIKRFFGELFLLGLATLCFILTLCASAAASNLPVILEETLHDGAEVSDSSMIYSPVICDNKAVWHESVRIRWDYAPYRLWLYDLNTGEKYVVARSPLKTLNGSNIAYGEVLFNGEKIVQFVQLYGDNNELIHGVIVYTIDRDQLSPLEVSGGSTQEGVGQFIALAQDGLPRSSDTYSVNDIELHKNLLYYVRKHTFSDPPSNHFWLGSESSVWVMDLKNPQSRRVIIDRSNNVSHKVTSIHVDTGGRAWEETRYQSRPVTWYGVMRAIVNGTGLTYTANSPREIALSGTRVAWNIREHDNTDSTYRILLWDAKNPRTGNKDNIRSIGSSEHEQACLNIDGANVIWCERAGRYGDATLYLHNIPDNKTIQVKHADYEMYGLDMQENTIIYVEFAANPPDERCSYTYMTYNLRKATVFLDAPKITGITPEQAVPGETL
ncbi:MAG: hypothetical protein ABH875_04015, partial [Candidatus Omnitrophota bacterium]